jgi:DNA-binding NarL/FixJ family response regulator
MFQLAAGGHSNKEIALKLSISEHTVASHFIKIFRKLNVGTRAEAIVYCIKHNLLTLKAES